MTCNRSRAVSGASCFVFSCAVFAVGAAHATPVPLNLNASTSLAAPVSAASVSAAFIGPMQPGPVAPAVAVGAVAAAPAQAIAPQLMGPLQLTPSALPPSLALSVRELPAIAQDGEKKATLVQRLVEAGSEMTQQTLQGVEGVQKTVEGWQQKGTASWYGPGFHGRKTASGERFNTNELTAAHLSLPFGTRLLVRNEKNGKEVVVRVNDRGPYIKSRILDLSQAAAKALGIQGVGRVIIQRLEADEAARKPVRKAN